VNGSSCLSCFAGRGGRHGGSNGDCWSGDGGCGRLGGYDAGGRGGTVCGGLWREEAGCSIEVAF
jgi:hypothetical protein